MNSFRHTTLATLGILMLTIGAAQARPNPHEAEVNRRYDIAGCKEAHRAQASALRKEAEEHCRKEHGTKLERFDYRPTNCDFSVQGKPPTYAVGKVRFDCAAK